MNCMKHFNKNEEKENSQNMPPISFEFWECSAQLWLHFHFGKNSSKRDFRLIDKNPIVKVFQEYHHNRTEDNFFSLTGIFNWIVFVSQTVIIRSEKFRQCPWNLINDTWPLLCCIVLINFIRDAYRSNKSKSFKIFNEVLMRQELDSSLEKIRSGVLSY